MSLSKRPPTRFERMPAVCWAIVALDSATFEGPTRKEAFARLADALPAIKIDSREFKPDAKDVRRAIPILHKGGLLKAEGLYDHQMKKTLSIRFTIVA